MNCVEKCLRRMRTTHSCLELRAIRLASVRLIDRLRWGVYQRIVSLCVSLLVNPKPSSNVPDYFAGATKPSHFTDWSEWSVCDRHCTQNRVKRCRSRKDCGTTVLRVSTQNDVHRGTANGFFWIRHLSWRRKSAAASTRERDDEDGASNANVGDIDRRTKSFTSFKWVVIRRSFNCLTYIRQNIRKLLL